MHRKNRFNDISGRSGSINCIRPAQAEALLSKRLLAADIPLKKPIRNIIEGIARYFACKNLITPGNIECDIDHLKTGVEHLYQLTMGKDFYKSNAFSYISEAETIAEVLSQIMANTRFWINRFGIEFFERYSPHSRERKTMMLSSIDELFSLSAKAGSGAGTFSVDFAIGMQPKKYARNIPNGEIWRSGIDIEQTGENIALRIIRTGSALKITKEKYDQKREASIEFKKRYGLTPQRALAFLTMYIGKDLQVNEIKALSTEGAQNYNLHPNRSIRVHFDYSRLFQSVGFEISDSPHWLIITDLQRRFYKVLGTDKKNSEGLRSYETAGLDRVLDAFRRLESVTDTSVQCPLTVCADESKAELEKAWETFRKIHQQ